MNGNRTVVYRDEGGEWRWRRVAANGRVVADSGEGYEHRVDCERMAHELFPDDDHVSGDGPFEDYDYS